MANKMDQDDGHTGDQEDGDRTGSWRCNRRIKGELGGES
jgi:hypothetical protein